MTTPTADKPEFVLFMIPGDKFCINFLNKLKTKQELMKKINLVDINTIPAIPDEVDEVPCIYDGKRLYKGKEGFTWLNEKMLEFLSPANDGLMYSFIDGQDEQVFSGYSLLDQKNGSFGMGPEGGASNNDPTRMSVLTDNSNKNRTLENLMSTRNQDIDVPISGGSKQNLNKC
jgi:hypothetical protein